MSLPPRSGKPSLAPRTAKLSLSPKSGQGRNSLFPRSGQGPVKLSIAPRPQLNLPPPPAAAPPMPAGVPMPPPMSDGEFTLFGDLMFGVAGVRLRANNQAMLAGRLWKRMFDLGLQTYRDYHALVKRDSNELLVALDLITTHETSFFREPQHFDFLRDLIKKRPRGLRPFRVWSAACSTGEEPYTIAMVLAEAVGETPYEVIGTDISARAVAFASAGVYRQDQANGIPPQLRLKYFQPGAGDQKTSLVATPRLRRGVSFFRHNLMEEAGRIGEVDVIFLRNVMIYFEPPVRQAVVSRLLRQLPKGGYFLCSHTESLQGLNVNLTLVSPATYRKD